MMWLWGTLTEDKYGTTLQFADYLGLKHRKVTPLRPEEMAIWNASRTHLARCSAQLLTGSNRCTSSWETIERLLIILLVSLLPLPSLEDQSGSSCPAPLVFHSKQIWNHHYCVSMMHTRKSRWRLSLRAGDLWRILTNKLEILCW